MSISDKAEKAAVKAFEDSVSSFVQTASDAGKTVGTAILATVARLVPVLGFVPAKDKNARGEIRRKAEKSMTIAQVKVMVGLAVKIDAAPEFEEIRSEGFDGIMAFYAGHNIRTSEQLRLYLSEHTENGEAQAKKSAATKSANAGAKTKEADEAKARGIESDRINALDNGRYVLWAAGTRVGHGNTTALVAVLRDAIRLAERSGATVKGSN